MNYQEIELIVRLLAVVVSVIITFIVKPLIDSKFSAQEQQKLEDYIKLGIRCAEQIYTPEEWAEKKAFVLNYISNILADNELVKIELTPEQIDVLIEGMVQEIKHG